MDNQDNILVFLPDEHEIYFYQGIYYGLTEVLKKVPHTFASDVIKQELFNTKLKIMQIQSRYQPKPPKWGS
jgi:hypothetical protein